MATEKVLILRWSGSAYDSLGGLLELVADEFAGMHVAPETVLADGPDWPNILLQRLLEGDLSFALTMSGIGTDIRIDGRLIWEHTKVPLFNWCCDHPCYFPLRHGIRSPYLIHGYVFPDHARYNLMHLHPNGMAFAAHLGIPPRSLFRQAPLPLSGRNGRIMFTKTGADTNAIEAKWQGYGEAKRQLLLAAAEELYDCATRDFLPVLQRLAEPRGIFFNGANNLALTLIRELDAYIRFKRANLVMRTIRRYPVDIFGTGWEHIDRDGTAARFHGPLPWRSMVALIPAYLGCLSTNPLVQESVHDRVFFSLAAGVAPISDGNAFASAQMPRLSPYCFDFSKESIERAVEAVLTAPAEAIYQTEETWRALDAPFGLRRSAEQIAQAAQMFNMNFAL